MKLKSKVSHWHCVVQRQCFAEFSNLAKILQTKVATVYIADTLGSFFFLIFEVEMH